MSIDRIGIVGLGPRGLTLLERIVANERADKSADLELYLFDANPPGVGSHDPEQDDLFLVNTVAGQITQFSDATLRAAGPILEGPSFYEWLADERLSKLGSRRGDLVISSDGYYSRGLFGRYLHWVYHYLVGLAPAHVKVTLIREAVVDTHRVTNGSWALATKTGAFSVDYLFLTTGHTKPARHVTESKPAPTEGVLVDDPYPIKEKLAFVRPDMTVAIEGMGLTMFDVLAELTVGRGGRFVDGASGKKEYVASGREPRLVAYSRSGLPLTARARNQKGVSVQYAARFLLADKVRALRETRKLDFVTDVFPLLLADMQYAYYEAYLREAQDPAATTFCRLFSRADALEREALIEKCIPAQDRFSWEQLVNPIPCSALVAPATFEAWLLDHLHQDQVEAKKGNVDGPLKAASDVVRDLRDNLRAAIDFGGLTEDSHRWLLSEFAPVMNRIAVGPPVSRIAELVALVEARVLDVGFGPGATCRRAGASEPMRVVSALWPERSVAVDTLVAARVSMHSPKDDASPLLQGLLAAGHVRLFRNGSFHPGGIEVCRNFHWVSEHGSCVENAWSLGIPTEGVKWYTFVVPRSGVNSTALVDAGRAVTKMLSAVKSRAIRRSGHVDGLSLMPSPESTTAFAALHGALA